MKAREIIFGCPLKTGFLQCEYTFCFFNLVTTISWNVMHVLVGGLTQIAYFVTKVKRLTYIFGIHTIFLLLTRKSPYHPRKYFWVSKFTVYPAHLWIKVWSPPLNGWEGPTSEWSYLSCPPLNGPFYLAHLWMVLSI